MLYSDVLKSKEFILEFAKTPRKTNGFFKRAYNMLLTDLDKYIREGHFEGFDDAIVICKTANFIIDKLKIGPDYYPCAPTVDILYMIGGIVKHKVPEQYGDVLSEFKQVSHVKYSHREFHDANNLLNQYSPFFSPSAGEAAAFLTAYRSAFFKTGSRHLFALFPLYKIYLSNIYSTYIRRGTLSKPVYIHDIDSGFIIERLYDYMCEHEIPDYDFNLREFFEKYVHEKPELFQKK